MSSCGVDFMANFARLNSIVYRRNVGCFPLYAVLSSSFLLLSRLAEAIISVAHKILVICHAA
jgi:hypothetical protein